jgi:hypothetical protein
VRGIGQWDLAFFLGVAILYVGAASLIAVNRDLEPDRMMVLAQRILQGRLDSPTFATTVDSVAQAGRYYLAVGPLHVFPYVPLAPFPALHGAASFIVTLAFGLPAAWLALPLARAYGARGATAYWVAVFIAFGTLLSYVAVSGNMYYLAHAESFLALELFLIEWVRRRRPAMLSTLLAVSFLARPTTILAALPFGLMLLWQNRSWLRAAVSFAAPLACAVALYGAFNYARFGSPLESGYAISLLSEPSLILRRAQGIFSIDQAPENLRLALLALPKVMESFPFVLPDKHGLSMLLVSPGLLVAFHAGVGPPIQRLLWITAGLVAVPVFLYYGGGYIQYGFRYSLDFTPFLAALVAIGASKRFGKVEAFLFIASALSVTYGIFWQAGVSWPVPGLY